MFIIFDLDDTLIDTSGSITPLQLRRALSEMVEAGLVLPFSFSQADEELQQLNRSSETASLGLSTFLKNVGGEKFLQVGLAVVYGDIGEEVPILPLQGVVELLPALKREHRLALVTVGDPKRQIAKMKRAGIDSSLFSRITVSSERNKKPHYEALIEEFSLSPSEVVVCGDRIAIDLVPARELGCKTIHLAWGRGKLHQEAREVDFVIAEFNQIMQVISSL